MNKIISNYDEIDVSKLGKQHLNVVMNILDMNDRSEEKIPASECFMNICHFISAFPDLSDEDYYRLSRYNYEEEWFCYLYRGLGNNIKIALDYCSSYSDEVQDMYLHYLIFIKYLGNDIKKKQYLFVNLEDIEKLYKEAYEKMLIKIEKEEKLCIKIS